MKIYSEYRPLFGKGWPTQTAKQTGMAEMELSAVHQKMLSVFYIYQQPHEVTHLSVRFYDD